MVSTRANMLPLKAERGPKRWVFMQRLVSSVMDPRLADLMASWLQAMASRGHVDAPLETFSRHADNLLVIEMDDEQFRYKHYGRGFVERFGTDLSGRVIDLLPAEIMPADRRGILEFEYNFARKAGRPLWRSYTAPFGEGRTETWQRLVLPLGDERLAVGAYPVNRAEAGEDAAIELLRLVINRVPVVLDANGTVRDLALSLKTFTDTRQQVAELEVLATVDPLTGVANSRHFHRMAGMELDHAQRMGRPFSVLALDIDHFKRVNDTYGHAVGDAALKLFVEGCRRALRDLDILGRVGGEEFAVALPNSGADGARILAERLRKQVEGARLDLADGGQLAITVSIGVATSSPAGRHPPFDDNPSLAALLERADGALYRSKAEGRNRVTYAGEDVAPILR